MILRLATVVLVCAASMPAYADTDTLHVTDAEKTACTADAVRLCSSAYPDELKLLGCMKQNRSQLSKVCRVAFDAGVKRRRL